MSTLVHTLPTSRESTVMDNPTGAGEGVLEYCQWQVSQPDATTLVFEAIQSIGAFKLQLVRSISLTGRTVTSHTKLTNLGDSILPVSWFPHPFFPYPAGRQLFKMSTDCRLVEPHSVLTQDQAGFVSWQTDSLASGTGSSRKDKSPNEYSDQIAMAYMETVDPAPLAVMQMHPKVGMVSAVCSFAPSPTVVGGETYGEAIPLWGNQWAVSWEPFLNFELEQSASKEWSISYSFGEQAASSGASSNSSSRL